MNVIDGVVRYAHDAHEVSINTVSHMRMEYLLF